MWNYKKSVDLSLFVCWFLSAVLLVLLFIGPWVFTLYMTEYRGFDVDGDALINLKTTFAACFYPSAVFGGIIFFRLIKLLNNIKSGNIFIEQNPKLLRGVSWSCFAIGAITFVGGFFYMPFMLVALSGGFVGVLLRVLKNVMQSAVEIQKENDLTI